MPKLIQARVGHFRGISFFNLPDEMTVNRDDMVVLDIDRGLEFGQIVADPAQACKGKTESASGNVVRLTTKEDTAQVDRNKLRAQDAIKACLQKISELKLDMQLVKGEYSFDSSKIIFFFVSEGRVDFRSLVKDLARLFRVRIELKQIGVRDKAKIIGGFGVCGRELCCSSFLRGFHPLSVKMSKEQNLPLNPTRISGVCGRIKCCMAYEYSVYREYAKELPKVGERINTPSGKGKVIDLNILKRVAVVDLGEGQITRVNLAVMEQAV